MRSHAIARGGRAPKAVSGASLQCGQQRNGDNHAVPKEPARLGARGARDRWRRHDGMRISRARTGRDAGRTCPGGRRRDDAAHGICWLLPGLRDGWPQASRALTEPPIADALTSELVARASTGETAAIEALLRLAQPDIRRYARRTCGSAVDAGLVITPRR